MLDCFGKIFIRTSVVLGLFLLTAVVGSTGCSGEKQDVQKNQKLLVAGIPPVATLLREIGGDGWQVRSLIPPGGNAHDYSPTPGDVRHLQQAEIFFKIDLPLETLVLERVLSNSSVKICNVAEGIALYTADGNLCSSPELADHHVWLSPANGIVICRNIEKAFIAHDPPNADRYRNNAAKLIQELEVLQLELQESLKSHAGKSVLVYHPAFGYFVREFQLTQAAVEQDGKEPTIRQFNQLCKEYQGHTFLLAPVESRSESVQKAAELMNCQVLALDPMAEDLVENLRAVGAAVVTALEGYDTQMP